MIKQFAKSESKNDDQLQIIFNIIDRCETKDEVSKMVSLLSSRTKVGLTFDEAPIVKSKNKVWILEKDRELSFIGDKDSPRHKLILGDNYDALNNLLITHRNRIDVIYIDPPYNTGGSNLGYHDKFTKDAWLNFMKERMILAKELLKDNGVIFVSLDDNMQAYFKVMMDEVFGENNFVASLPRTTSIMGKNDEKQIALSHDYVLVYSKLEVFNRDNEENEYFNLEDDLGKYHLKNPLDVPALPYSKNLDFPINFNGKVFNPIKHETKQVSWRWSREKVEWAIQNNLLVEKNGRLYTKTYQSISFKKNNGRYIFEKKIEGGSYKTQLLQNEFGNRPADKMLESLSISGFKYSKPIELIIKLISIIPNNKNIIVLDFFAGSGTTGHAVLELNKKDDGNREFILCTKEIDDGNNIGKDICWERLYRINKGKTSLGETNFEWVKKNKPFNNSLDVYRVEELDISIFNNDKNLNLDVYNELNPSLDLQQEDIPYIMNNLTNHLWRK